MASSIDERIKGLKRDKGFEGRERIRKIRKMRGMGMGHENLLLKTRILPTVPKSRVGF